MSKEYAIKTKKEQTQWVLLKMLFLLDLTWKFLFSVGEREERGYKNMVEGFL